MEKVVILLLICYLCFLLLIILVCSSLIWGGTLATVFLSFLFWTIHKHAMLNNSATLSQLVTPHFYGNMLKWEMNEPACRHYPESEVFVCLTGLLGIAWLFAVYNIPALHLIIVDFIHHVEFIDSKKQPAFFKDPNTIVDYGTFISLISGGTLTYYLAKLNSSLLHSAVRERIRSVENSIVRGDQIGALEQQIAGVSAQIGFIFPSTFSSTLDTYIENNKATLISNVTPLEQKITELSTDAKQVLAELEDAGQDLMQAKIIYDDALRIVTKSASIALIQGLEQIHAYLNTTALTEFLSVRRWQDFKEAVAEAVTEMKHLTEVSKDYKNSQSETNEASVPATEMSLEMALEILGLKAGCSPSDVKKAWVKEAKKWHEDQRQHLEPHILEILGDKLKDVNVAKDVLLGKI